MAEFVSFLELATYKFLRKLTSVFLVQQHLRVGFNRILPPTDEQLWDVQTCLICSTSTFGLNACHI